MNKQQLASRIWAAANKMRSKIDANEYKDYFLGFIFYKFLSDGVEKKLRADGWDDDDIKSDLNEEHPKCVAYLKKNLGYFIAYEDLFSTWVNPKVGFVASQVTDALNAFARNIAPEFKPVFDKIFDTLNSKIANLGETGGARTKAISKLLDIVKDVPTDGSDDYDVLGFIYEYLIGKFAANAGKKAGEFYTPHEVGLLMAEIVAYHHREKKELKIYDPTSGSGSLLLNIGRTVAQYIENKNNITYYAQELKDNTYNLTRMNLVMRGINPTNIITRNADTLADDWPMIEDGVYTPLYVDAVVSNPPYSAEWDPASHEHDVRYRDYGIAPKSKADYAFLLHDLYHVKPDGIMTIVLPHGVLFRGKVEKEEAEAMIRKNLIERNQIDAIIGLPPKIFFGTPISTVIMVLKQHRANEDVLFIDASRLSIKEDKQYRLTAAEVRRIADTWICRKSDDPSFARAVTRDEIRENGYNLNIPRYVESAEKPETWDISATMFGGFPKSEIDAHAAYWSAFPSLKNALFKVTKTAYTTLNADPAKLIANNRDVKKFKLSLAKRFKNFPDELNERLIKGWKKVKVSSAQLEITKELFARLKGIPFVDAYAAYQIFFDQWQIISGDLEILQDEGFDAVRVIDPKMTLKKNAKTGEEEEVQVGWEGRIMPFRLIQENRLADGLQRLEKAGTELTAYESDLDAAKDEFEEDELQDSFWNDEKGVFISTGIAAKAKTIQEDTKKQKFAEDSFEAKILKVNAILGKIKTKKTEIRLLKRTVEEKTKALIVNLTDKDARLLLHDKWIRPIVDRIVNMGECVGRDVLTSILEVGNKYCRPLVMVSNECDSATNELISFISKIKGSREDLDGLAAFAKLVSGCCHGVENITAACFEKLFVKSGEDVPRLRIGGHKGHWVVGKLSNWLTISDEINGDRFSKNEVLSVSGEYGVVNQIKYQGRSFAGASIARYRVVRKGNVVYTKSPLKAAPFGIIKTAKQEEGIVSPLYAVYVAKDNCDPNFIQSYFDNRARLNLYLRGLVNKGAKNTILITDAAALDGEVCLPPTLDEQRDIGSFFNALERVLRLKAEQSSLLRNIRSACMERMFV